MTQSSYLCFYDQNQFCKIPPFHLFSGYLEISPISNFDVHYFVPKEHFLEVAKLLHFIIPKLSLSLMKLKIVFWVLPQVVLQTLF
jgi:hypothetical protein